MPSWKPVFAIGATLSLWGGCAADTFTLSDGRVLIGVIAKTDASTVWIDTTIAGIRATVPIEKHRIERHEINDLKPDYVAPEKHNPASAKAGAKVDSFAIIPIVGTIGEDVFARAIDETLQTFDRNGIATVVFFLDTQGGSVGEAREIKEVLKKYSSRIQYHAAIKNAISAGIWIAFSCDEFFFFPDAIIGGAVAYTGNPSTGNATVDAKMNSILASELAAIAESKGHPGSVARAMVLLEAEVYLHEGPEGVSFFSPNARETETESVVIDNAKTILTLTAEDAIRGGMGSLLQGMDSLEASIGATFNRNASDRAEAIQFRHAEGHRKEQQRIHEEAERLERYRRDLLTAIPALVNAVNAAVREAEGLDPDRHYYPLDSLTRRFTSQSLTDWRNRTDEAIDGWFRVGQTATSLRDSINDAERLNVTTSGMNSIDAKRFIDLANRRISTLRANRSRDR